MTQPELSDMQAFVTVARRRSFRQAADELGLAPSTLSHMLRVLEEKLGVRLLHRTTRSVAPTEAGERFLRRVEPLLRELGAAVEEVNGTHGRLAGVVRINAGEAVLRQLLRKVVPAFHARHPQVGLDLFADGRLVDIVAEGFDAGIRLAESVPQGMHAVPFGGPTRFLPVAAPAYLARRPAPRTPDDLHAHVCIRQRLPGGRVYRWEFGQHGAAVEIDPPGALVLNDVGLMVEAALSGMGIAYLPESAVRDHLASGRLVALLEAWCPRIPGLVLYYPGHRHVPATLRAFIDVLLECIPPV